MEALNTPNYNESLREAYGNKSMNTETLKLNREEEDTSSGEEENPEDFDSLKNQKSVEILVEDEIKCRGKRPLFDKFSQQFSLNFEGRVKHKSSKES